MKNGLILFLVALVLVGPAQAQLDRPDLPDGSWIGGNTLVRYGASFSQVSTAVIAMYNLTSASGATNYVGGYIEIIASDATAQARLLFKLYEPDTVKRSRSKAQLRQKTHLGVMLSVVAPTTSFSVSAVVPDCSATFKGDYDTPDAHMQWKVSCSQLAAASELGLTEAQQAKLLAIFAPNPKAPNKFGASTSDASFGPVRR